MKALVIACFALAAMLLAPAPSRAQDSSFSAPDGGVPVDASVTTQGDGWADLPDHAGDGADRPLHEKADGGERSDGGADGAPPGDSRPQARPEPARSVGPVYEVIVRARRPMTRDRTQDDLQVDGQRLRETTRASTLEALSQESAGIYVPGRGAFHGVASGATGGVTIRGLGGSPNSQVLVVEDGVPDYMGLFGHPIPDAYVPFLIEKALVVKGGDSVLYGTNAMGGVVVLRSRWRDTDGFELLNDAGYGSYSTTRETVSLLARKGDLDLAAAFHALSSAGHRDNAGGNSIVGLVAGRYRLARGLRLTVRNKLVHLTGNDPGPATHPYGDHWYDVWRNNTSLRLGWKRELLRLTVTPFLNLGVHRLYDGFLSHDYVAGSIAEAEIKTHRVARLLVGVAGQYVDGRVENRIKSEKTPVEGVGDLSTYVQLTLQPIAPLSIVAGARALYSLVYGPMLLHKGGLRWAIHGGLHAQTRIARKFRQPTIRELYLPFPTANPDLRPEHAVNWDFGLGYDGEYLEVSCVGYRTEADEMIRYFGVWPTAEVVNIDRIVIWGVEGQLRLRRLGPFSIAVSGDWRDVGRYTRQNPRAKLDIALEARHAIGRHLVAGSLAGEFVHGLYMANYGRNPLDDAFAVDLALRYRYTASGRGMRLEPYVLLRNILDNRYAFVEGYPMPGFNVLGGIKVGI